MENILLISVIVIIILIIGVIISIIHFSKKNDTYLKTKFVAGLYQSDLTNIEDTVLDILDKVPDYPEFMLLEIDAPGILVPEEEKNIETQMSALKKTEVKFVDYTYAISYRNIFGTSNFVCIVWNIDLDIWEERSFSSTTLENSRQTYLAVSYNLHNFPILLVCGGGEPAKYTDFPEFYNRRFILYGGFGNELNINNSKNCPVRKILNNEHKVHKFVLPVYVYQSKKASFPLFSTAKLSSTCFYYFGAFFIKQ